MAEETEYSFASSTKILSPDENQPKTVVYKVYKRRWFLLATLMVLNISNAMVKSLNKYFIFFIQI